MPRQKKKRQISFSPAMRVFKPQGIPTRELEEEHLKFEELEALRLKDIVGMHQADCAKAMHVSRQTFQLILEEARKKVARALYEGRAIRIAGGDYQVRATVYHCLQCEERFTLDLEKEKKACPHCGSSDLICDARHRRQRRSKTNPEQE